MKVLFLARNDGTDVRQAKICNSLIRMGHDVTYVGWNREPGNHKVLPLDEHIKVHVFEWPGGYGKHSLSGWPQFSRYVQKAMAAVRPEVVHARNEPMAALALPMKGIYYRHLILDIFDSLLNDDLSLWLRCSMWGIRKAVYKGSDRVIETSEDLKQQFLPPQVAKKTVVIMNVPPDPGDNVASIFPSAPAVQICTGGSLMRHRDALEALLQVVDQLPPGTVQIRASGWFHDDYSRDVFAKHPAVDYRYLNTAAEFREQAALCDALTYLDGFSRELPEYRSCVLPNRVFDAMSVGRPIIVTSRLKIAGWIEREKLGYICEPGDIEGLKGLIVSLGDRRSELPKFSGRVRRIFKNQYSWPSMEKRLQRLYDGLRQ